MIRLIEALNYRCLHYVHRPLQDFHVLVGPNASGKTTFLEVVAFLGALVKDGLESALYRDAEEFKDLVWCRSASRFELAVELEMPKEARNSLNNTDYDLVRYEVALGMGNEPVQVSILGERVLLRKSAHVPSHRTTSSLPSSIFFKEKTRTKTVVNKMPEGNDNFYVEVGKGWRHSFKLGSQKSALANLPDDESKFPATTWLRRMLQQSVVTLVLNSERMRRPSPFTSSDVFVADGSNLPWMLYNLAEKKPLRFQEWINHVQTALPDLETVRTIERPEDRHRYLMVRYRNGIEVPSWVVSDGTLRLLALTLLAYLPFPPSVWLIEEPENGIHPQAVETVFQSLSSMYGIQLLLATHSPVILSLADASSVLCFSKDPSGATSIVLGSEHPALKHWRGEENLGVLFAGGVLG